MKKTSDPHTTKTQKGNLTGQSKRTNPVVKKASQKTIPGKKKNTVSAALPEHIRRAGVLLPISSLPSPYGIGSFGDAAYRFVDFLERSHQSLWQILPLGPTGYGDSPYQSFSTFAGNPYFIDLAFLVRDGLLTKAECAACDFGDRPDDIDYEKLYYNRFPLLRKAYARALKKGLESEKAYEKFCRKNAFWLEDYALYMAVKNRFGGVSYLQWDEDIRLRTPKALAKYRKECADEIGFYRFLQYEFAVQWDALKKYANAHGVQIVGDIPIYVSPDSADIWANPELFQLDAKGYPKAVAGCPPDYFSETGQLWGNPLYDWKYHKKTGYAWWISRIRACFERYDIVRIDHFRGFDAYWSIPYGDPTAVGGKWVKGPGYALFQAIENALGKQNVIAEDLGAMTDSVRNMVRKTGYPGMKVLQFGFEAYGNSEYLPMNYDRNFVVYTGTHDNDTLKALVMSLSKADAKYMKDYLGVKKRKQLPEAIIRMAFSSSADTCIIPIQDYLELGNEARINLPSTLGGNWRWRLVPGQLTGELEERLAHLTKLYCREDPARKKKEESAKRSEKKSEKKAEK